MHGRYGYITAADVTSSLARLQSSTPRVIEAFNYLECSTQYGRSSSKLQVTCLNTLCSEGSVRFLRQRVKLVNTTDCGPHLHCTQRNAKLAKIFLCEHFPLYGVATWFSSFSFSVHVDLQTQYAQTTTTMQQGSRNNLGWGRSGVVESLDSKSNVKAVSSHSL